MIPLKNLSVTVAVTLLTGLFITLVLYQFDWRRFIRTSLAVKIALWIPIYIAFVWLLHAPAALVIAVLLVISALALREATHGRRTHNLSLFLFYWLGFTVCFLHLVLFPLAFADLAKPYIIALAIASVYSDVVAFFAGNFIGRHKLPKSLNQRKSWEGVAGQLIGALLGIVVIRFFVLPDTPLWLWLPVGVGSAAGDLVNSYFKRQAGVRDWSNALPGHGGYLDRLSSLVGAFTLSFYALILWT